MSGPLFHDWYSVLGVAPDATPAQITRAWRQLAQRHHPDRNANSSSSTQEFIRAREAFDVLSNPNLRIIFDGQRREWLSRGEVKSQLVVADTGAFSVRDWWREMREDRRRIIPLPQGDKASVLVRIPLRNMFTENEKLIRLRVARTCSACLGSNPRCPVCAGSGQRFVSGLWRVTIPAGFPDGGILKLAGQGHQGPRFGSPGDVLITVVWVKRGLWRYREGQLVGRLRVAKAMLEKGGVQRLRSPTGEWGHIQLSPGTIASRQLRLPGLGLPDRLGKRADAWLECYSSGS